ncbi:hypothetical protein Golomagni_06866 [Golovinomyces magnicellulatus]|nr:hypothetical protein Golomagni_06866 [Golovinomyces magnicellulatus]
MPSTTKPKLEKLATPITASFPSEITSASTATPVSALAPPRIDVEFVKTPISPPAAYADFLSKAMAMKPTGLPSPETSSDSAPASAASDDSEASSKTSQSLDNEKAKNSPSSSRGSDTKSTPSNINTAFSPSNYTQLPMSAPPTGLNSFPSLKLPPSPAISNFESPISAASSLRSPFSARSFRPIFDWDAALKARYSDQKRPKSSRASVRHIKEVVTRTVTYTPKMEPAPRGKRRKVDWDHSTDSF